METKIVGILVMTLLIATAVLPVTGNMNVGRNQDVETPTESDDSSSFGNRILTLQPPPYKTPWIQQSRIVDEDWHYWPGGDMYAIGAEYGGNVGIGTKNPTSKLEVVGGNVEFKYDLKGYLNLTSREYNTIIGTGYSALSLKAESNAAIGGGWISITPNSNGWKHGGVRIFSSDDTDNTQPSGSIEFVHETITGGVATEVLNMIIRGDTGNVGIGTVNPTTKLHVNGPVATAITTVFAGSSWLTPYDITDDDSVIFAKLDPPDTVGWVKLPPADPCPGREYTIKFIDGNYGEIIYVIPSSGDLIDDCNGFPEFPLEPCDSIIVVSDGNFNGHWYIVADYESS